MQQRPNILFIMADDHATKAISCYGHGLNQTPNIDRLAALGIRLNHCYVTNSICTPSRAAILTGTHNHINKVTTLRTFLDNGLPNVAKELKANGYQTAVIGKWHLGEGPKYEPRGFDHWCVLPGQGRYFNPEFIDGGKKIYEQGYVTNLITEKTIDWLKNRDRTKPFFMMCHHKAPHRSWEPHPDKAKLHGQDIKVPESFSDDYKNRAKSAAAAKMRIREDLTFLDLGLKPIKTGKDSDLSADLEKIPNPEEVKNFKLTDSFTGEVFVFNSKADLDNFKYQRYIKRYLRTVESLDESVDCLLNFIELDGIIDDTIIIYTSDQGFFLGEHGWFDKRFIYEQSFQMPFIVSYPKKIKSGSISNDIVSNVDFAPTLLDFAGIRIPEYMQGKSFRKILEGKEIADWPQLAYHRYWMHRDATHNAYAHYGVRDHRYKLIYWYNESFDLPGTGKGGQEPEWEFFDLKNDPLELFNLIEDETYSNQIADLYSRLNDLQSEINDRPSHSHPPFFKK